MNNYEEKLEKRRERYEQRAEKARQEAAFVHRKGWNGSYWQVSELRTGLAISDTHDTMKEAIADAIDKLHSAGPEETQNCIRRFLDKRLAANNAC